MYFHNEEDGHPNDGYQFLAIRHSRQRKAMKLSLKNILLPALLVTASEGAYEAFTDNFDGPSLDEAYRQEGLQDAHLGITDGAYFLTDERDGQGTKITRSTGGEIDSFRNEIEFVMDPFRLLGNPGTQSDFKWKMFGPDGFMELVLNSFGKLRLYHNDSEGSSGNITENSDIGIVDGDRIKLIVDYDVDTDKMEVTYQINDDDPVVFHSGGGISGRVGDLITNFVQVEMFKWNNSEVTKGVVAVNYWNLGAIQEPEAPAGPLVLSIGPDSDGLEFTWRSQEGKVYDLVSSTTLETSPATWAPYNDGVNSSYENIAASGSGTNTLSKVGILGSPRLFAIVEKEFQPLLIENFDSLGNLSLPAGWEASDNGEGSQWQVGTPSGVNTEPSAAASGVTCAGINIGGDYTPSADASLTTSVFTVPASGATLSYSQYIDTDFPPQADVGSIVVLSAATNLPLVDGDVALNIEGTSQEWTKESLPLPEAANGQEVRLQFRFVSDNDANVFAGFYVDNVSVVPGT
ncbi:choice-of-anchor J domain-containing protein [bacterium]|nr:choice-of-anchor J domain-containing protein [bacterium]MDB4543122.1 choice-of-anchor J domain-containing protein [bacterium]